MFHMGTKAFYFDTTLKYGGAKYRPTGRGFVMQHEGARHQQRPHHQRLHEHRSRQQRTYFAALLTHRFRRAVPILRRVAPVQRFRAAVGPAAPRQSRRVAAGRRAGAARACTVRGIYARLRCADDSIVLYHSTGGRRGRYGR